MVLRQGFRHSLYSTNAMTVRLSHGATQGMHKLSAIVEELHRACTAARYIKADWTFQNVTLSPADAGSREVRTKAQDILEVTLTPPKNSLTGAMACRICGSMGMEPRHRIAIPYACNTMRSGSCNVQAATRPPAHPQHCSRT